MPGTGPVVPPKCNECGKSWEVGGPIWSDPIHDVEWVSGISRGVRESKNSYAALEKIQGLLTAVSEVAALL